MLAAAFGGNLDDVLLRLERPHDPVDAPKVGQSELPGKSVTRSSRPAELEGGPANDGTVLLVGVPDQKGK